ncbi:EamA family transporter RarD [Stenotrophomonas sp. YIM B06876]|uniref:EamA family transporter RarD n=1 Tax=Stenotrophomonas sp. YIM B06876 TaxID=3060211 RepID=UPI00273A24D4|nr:EamA family transporter RarD [Stenotrophomonas sp. YIM B06876]
MSKGVVVSLAASLLFGLMYYASPWLAPLQGEQIFGWRVLFAVPLVALMLHLDGERTLIVRTLRRIRSDRRLWLALPVTTAMVGVQLWLFLWAPLHGRGLQVSMGYFLLPLVMVLVGRVFYGERLSLLQALAVASAAAGVAWALLHNHGLSWEMLLVALGYPAYFLLRRHLDISHLGGFWVEMVLLLPVACWVAIGDGHGLGQMLAQRPALYVLIPLLGVVSAVALMCYMLAAKMLSFSLFGLLTYVEPVLLMLAALLLGESVGQGQWPTYIAIWIAVGLLALEGGVRLRSRA